MSAAVNGAAKRKANEVDGDVADETVTYEEYVLKDNERLRQEMREMKEMCERLKRQKERAEERLKNEIELRLKEKRESETVAMEQRLELEKMKREKGLIETSLRHKDAELDKVKAAIAATTAPEDIECDKCDFKTKSEVSLILHTINHKLSHPNQRRLILHPNMFSSRNPNSSYLYMCPICEGTALTRNEIYPHIYQNHTKEKAYKCTDCDIFFTHIDYLKTHHKHEHERQKSQRIRSIGFEIPKEPLITAVYMPSASRGTQTITGTPVAGAGDPTTSGGNNGSTYAYSPQVGADDQLRCSFPHCAFTTNNKQKLEFHISAHTNSKYKCPYCAYVGNILTDIYRHIKKSTKHEGKKVFECKKCDFGIDCEKSFKEHLRDKHYRYHTPEKEIDAAVEDIFLNKASDGNGNGGATEAPK